MAIKQQFSERLFWIDWMKIGATLAVIWGHFFSKGDVYVYVFNLQAFCVISGFLYKRAPDWGTCLRSAFWNLFVPTVILSVIMHAESYIRGILIGEPYPISWPWFFKWLLLGHRWCMGPCWYFYSLIVIRLIMQLIPEKKWLYAVLFALVAGVTIYLNHIGFQVSNANVNALLCFPFFIIGIFLKPLRSWLNIFSSTWQQVLLFIIAVAGVGFCGYYNDYVWMYLNGYGNYYLLYIIGGIAGTAALYALAKLLCRLPWRNTVISLSGGTMLIIGIHIIIVRRLTELPGRLWGEDLMLAILVLLTFVPIVRLAELYCPLLLGRYTKRKKQVTG